MSEPETAGEVAEEVTAAEAAALADAAFTQGFSSIHGDPAPTPATAVAGTESPSAAAVAAVPDATVEEPPAEAPRYLLQADVNAIVQRALEAHLNPVHEQLRKVNGKVGQLDDSFKKAVTPREFSKEDFPGLNAEYTELAEILAKDFQGKFLGNATVDPEEIATLVQTAVAAGMTTQATTLRDEINERFLNWTSPGWQDKLASSEFATWFETLPPVEQFELQESEDPLVVSHTLTTFDHWRDAGEAKAKAAAVTAADKAKRLQAAETPTRGSAAPVTNKDTDAENAFTAGFNSVRQGTR